MASFPALSDISIRLSAHTRNLTPACLFPALFSSARMPTGPEKFQPGQDPTRTDTVPDNELPVWKSVTSPDTWVGHSPSIRVWYKNPLHARLGLFVPLAFGLFCCQFLYTVRYEYLYWL